MINLACIIQMNKISIKTVIYNFFGRLLFLLVMSIIALPMLVLVFLVPQKYRYNKVYFFVSNIMYKAVLWASWLPIHITGKEHIPENPAIFVANHSSSFDIPLLGSLVNSHPHIWLAMTWLTKFWLFRLLLPRVAVLVDMSSPQKGGRSLIKTINLVKKYNTHIMIFPEGARYTDGKVHDFYGGFALLAKKMHLPVIPVRMFNLEKVYPPNTFWVHYHPVKVVIGEPMYMREDETDTEFKDRVHRWFIQQEQ